MGRLFPVGSLTRTSKSGQETDAQVNNGRLTLGFTDAKSCLEKRCSF